MKWFKTFMISCATALLFTEATNVKMEKHLRVHETINVEENPKIIKGINWFGFETEYKNLMCVWVHDIEWNLRKMKEIGFNYIRLPFSEEFVKEGNWENMDAFFKLSNELQLNVVLDFHRLHSTHQSFQPYDQVYSFDDFLFSWKKILDRYQHYENLLAIDIWNEYQGNNYVEWNNLARQIVSFIEAHFPDRFEYFIGGTNWGGNIHYMDLSDLSFSNRIRYSVHKYWFSDSEPYEEKWNYSFGDHTPVVNVGEWGYKSDVQNEVEWAFNFVDYLIEKNLRDTFFWTWSWNSGDTGGLLFQDCEGIDTKKLNLLKKLWDE
jgi:endoglucanase